MKIIGMSEGNAIRDAFQLKQDFDLADNLRLKVADIRDAFQLKQDFDFLGPSCNSFRSIRDAFQLKQDFDLMAFGKM